MLSNDWAPTNTGALYLALIYVRPGQETPEGLDALRRDPEMVALVPLREEIVGKALVVRVEDAPLERYFKPD